MGSKVGKVSGLITPSFKIPPEHEEKIEEIKKEDAVAPLEEFKTLPEKIAKSRIVVKNLYPTEIREIIEFKHFDRMRRMDYFFPYANLDDKRKSVKLYIDAPKTEMDMKMCKVKAKVCKELNMNYVILDFEEKDQNKGYYDALKQLGAV